MTSPLDRRALLTGMCQHCRHWRARFAGSHYGECENDYQLDGMNPMCMTTPRDFVCALYEPEPAAAPDAPVTPDGC